MAFIRLLNARIAFPSLFEKASFNGQETKYEVTFILEGKGPHVVEVGNSKADESGQVKLVLDKKADIEAVIKEAAVAKWGVKADAYIKALRPGNFFCFKDGDLKFDTAGYPGNMTLKASNAMQPRVFDGKKRLLTTDDGTIYSGCYCHAIAEIYAWENKNGKGISATVHQVMFAKDGEAFVGSRLSGDEFFDDVAAGADAADFV